MVEPVGRHARFGSSPHAEVGIDQLSGRREVDVHDAQLRQPALAFLEMIDGQRGPAKAEFEFAERADRPCPKEADAERIAELARLSGVSQAL